MAWFGSSKCECTDTLTDLKKRLVDVETRCLKLELEQNVFRNAVLRKLQRHQLSSSASIEEPDESESETKRLYSGVLIPEKG